MATYSRGEQRAESINPDGKRRRTEAGPSEEIGCISGVRGPSRLVCRRPRAPRDPRENSGGSHHRWESPLCPGVHVRRGRTNERERRKKVGTRIQRDRSRVSGEVCDYGARVTQARDDASQRRARAPVHKESVEMESADGVPRSAETHLIIARFRHLAPALNNALPLTHSLLPPLSIRPLCASMGPTGREVHGAFDPAAPELYCDACVASRRRRARRRTAPHLTSPTPSSNIRTRTSERRTIPSSAWNETIGDRREIVAD